MTSHHTLYDDSLPKQGYLKCRLPNQLLVSIITVVYNGAAFLEQTIQSVIEQSYPNVEYIIIDGGSSDNTLEIIKRYENSIDYWLSEPDQGIADAMNKGLSLASGEYILFIHADDYLANSLSLEQAMDQLDGYDITMFDIIYGHQSKKLKPRGFNFWMNFKTGVYHQGVICKRAAINRIGGFDTEFKIAMDYDFFLRAYQNGMTARRHPLVLSVMRDTGISSRQDWPSLVERLSEEKKVHLKNCTALSMSIVYAIYWPLYMFYRRARKLLNG